MQLTLIIMAAGIGRRYGGLKQIEPVGPDGEIIVDYSIYDAIRAGFERVVFVVRRAMECEFKEVIGNRLEQRISVAYALQEIDMLPCRLSMPLNRSKPWGTGQAILITEPLISGPFAVINADDFYGFDSFRVLGNYLRAVNETTAHEYAMVGYVLRQTLSEYGRVTRGVCTVDESGTLQEIKEIRKIARTGLDASFTDDQGVVHPLNMDSIVSMNMWGFTPMVYGQLRRLFMKFLQTDAQNDEAEFLIPIAVGTLVQQRQARVKVLPTSASWFGITYQQDKATVSKGIRSLIAEGQYPERLW